MIGILVLTFLVTLGISRLYIPQAIVAWDESVYLHWAYRVYHALKIGNVTNLWQITRMQFGYPPLTSWTIGAPLILFGFSVTSARIVGLVWFVIASMLIYGIGKLFDREKSQTIGIVSALLFMASPLMILYAGFAMKEMPGTALTLAVLYTYLVARKTDKLIWWFGSAFFLIALCFVKYNYGGLIVIALCIEAVFHFLESKSRAKIIRKYLLLFGPAGVIMLWWVFTPINRLSEFLSILLNSSWAGMIGMTNWWGHIIFYPYAILVMSSPSMLIGAVCLVSLVMAVFHFRDYRIRTLWILFMLNLVFGELHPGNMQERYIVTTMPTVFIIGAYIAVDFYTYVKKHLKSKIVLCVFYGVLVLGAGKVAYDVYHLPQFVYSVGPFVEKLALFNDRSAIIRYFLYDESVWAKNTWPDVMHERPQDIATYICSHVDLRKPVKVVGRSNELAPDFFDLQFDMSRDNGTYPRLPYSSYIVTVEVLPNSVYNTQDFQWFNAFIIPIIRQVEQDPTLTLLSSRDFQELGVSVHIYIPKTTLSSM